MMTNTSNDAIPKLADFGLCKFLGPHEKATEPFGTLGYVAPEVLTKQPYSFSCDVWSIGCITYALTCGALPFDHDSPKDTVKATISNPLIFDLEQWSYVSDEIKDFITGLLQKDPSQRFTIEQALNHNWFKQQIHSTQK